MNKKIMLLISAILSLSIVQLKSQDDDLKNLGFEEETYIEESLPYFGIGGGFTVSLIIYNFDETNKLFLNYGFGNSALSGPTWLYGGEGYLVTFWPKNVRIRIFGLGGSQSTSFDTLLSNVNLTRDCEFSVSLTGLSFDYAIVPFYRFAIIPGLAFGWGNMKADISQGKTFSWENFNSSIDSLYFFNRAEANFLYLQPNLSIEYAITDFLMFRLNAGYTLSLISKDAWTYNKSSKLQNVPDGINANGFSVQLGIFAGLFNF